LTYKLLPSAADGAGRAMDDKAHTEYLDRIGVASSGTLNADALRELHLAHLLTVPFENLSIHLGEPISLSPDDLIAKIVTRRRGGFCYELNGTFALLIERLGCRVERVAARVYGANGLGPPLDHLALVVHLPDGSGPWLADVGFGSHSTYPLDFESRTAQQDPGGTFLLADADKGDVDVLKDGSPQYRVERRERDLDEFVPTCWYQQTSPQSHFTQGTICSMLTPEGRISIAGRTLIRTSGGTRTEEELSTDGELLAAYRDYFGVSLPLVPDKVRLARP
jgi:N-hydroxyarylamine O-acetyltransferase